jgi:hypothetical protein
MELIMSNKILSLGLVTITFLFIPNITRAQNVIIQQGSSSATAVGQGNRAHSSTHQSASQHGGSNQVIIQQAESNSTAIGTNNTVINNVNQSSVQNRYSVSPTGQISIQRGISNGTAIGENNRVIGNVEQINQQNGF